MKLTVKEYTALGVLAVVLLIAYQKGLFSRDKGNVIDTSKGVKDGSTQTIENAEAKNKAVAIHTSLQGYFTGFWGDLYTILADLDKLNDADLIAVANQYAALYPNDDYPTLYAIINGTTANYLSSTYTLKYKILQRLKDIGL